MPHINFLPKSSTPPTLPSGSAAFDNLASGAKIHVPDSDAVTAYTSAAGWSDYSSIIVTP